MKNEFQYRLLKALSDKNISAAELSRLSGINKVAIHNYLNGKYVAKQDKCYALAMALDVDPGWLMTGDEPVKHNYIHVADEHGERVIDVINDDRPQTREARIISGGIDKLPKEQREQALAVLQAVFAQYADYFKKGDDE